MAGFDEIVIRNARENNLKGVSLRLPKHAVTVVVGVSGSGKSSLVFDTIAAESRRQLNLTYPGYVQQYLPAYGVPEVDAVEGLPVAMLIDQKRLGGNARSTVGTYSDVTSLLRLLYSRYGQPYAGFANQFSFNHPDGMCPRCQGLGFVQDIDLDALLDRDKSLNQGAIRFPTFQPGGWRLRRYTESGLFDNDKPLRDYTEHELEELLHAPARSLAAPPPGWRPSAKYEGVLPRLRRSFLNRESKEAARFRESGGETTSSRICPECHGGRLNRRILSCLLGGLSIADCSALPLGECAGFLEGLDLPGARHITRAAAERLRSLERLGLGYLTLSRSVATLSGGESGRLKVAKYLHSGLADLLYVFDEPSAGLHPRDVALLAGTFRSLCDRGNTVLVVEHDRGVIAMADQVVEMGPGPGGAGGSVVFQGSYTELEAADTGTARSLRQKTSLKTDPRPARGWYQVRGATLHNLKGVDARFPRACLTCIAGVAGSGKTSLSTVLAAAYPEARRVTQKEPGGSTRSTPATYVGVMDSIRSLFATANGVSRDLFSYNSKGGCPACHGKGVIAMDMAFLDDVVTVCGDCGGKRYRKEVLGYRYQGQNILEVMDMTAAEAADFFAGQDPARPLEALVEVGLGYLRLNQSLSSLSGGELQRTKLARHVDENAQLLILDEPTAGLHISDVINLLRLFDRLVERGNTLVLIEHDPDVVRRADWVVEMGPGGGDAGGEVLYAGPPAGMALCPRSVTAQYL